VLCWHSLLTFWNPVSMLSAATLRSFALCILPTHCCYILHISLAINIHFFPKQDWPGCHSSRGLSLFCEVWALKLPPWWRIRLGFMGYKAVYFIRWLSERFCCLHLHGSDVVDQNIDYVPAPWLSLPCILSDYRLNGCSVSILALYPLRV
jgi:hypothetical protein